MLREVKRLTFDYRPYWPSWKKGPWDKEPDKVQWLDTSTGLHCLAKRNGLGAWCGYVGVSKSHPYFGIEYDAIPNINCHGGLTYSDFCQEEDKEYGICHISEEDKVWWLGFDCAHFGDIYPAIPFPFQQSVLSLEYFIKGTPRNRQKYRTLAYVKKEIKKLAKQLSEVVS